MREVLILSVSKKNIYYRSISDLRTALPQLQTSAVRSTNPNVRISNSRTRQEPKMGVQYDQRLQRLFVRRSRWTLLRHFHQEVTPQLIRPLVPTDYLKINFKAVISMYRVCLGVLVILVRGPMTG